MSEATCNFQARLPAPLKRAVEKAAVRQGMSQNSVVQAALKEYLRRLGLLEEEEKART